MLQFPLFLYQRTVPRTCAYFIRRILVINDFEPVQELLIALFLHRGFLTRPASRCIIDTSG